MKLTLVLLLVVCWFGETILEPSPNIARAYTTMAQQSESKRFWRPGSYKGLTVGKSSKADLLAIMGEPQRIDIPEFDPDLDYVTYVYDHGGEFPGEFTVDVEKRSGLILFMSLQPENVSQADVIERFGKDYVLTKHKFCPGFEDEDSAPIYETTEGPLAFIEYRSRGIAILVPASGPASQISYRKDANGYGSERECPKGSAYEPVTSKQNPRSVSANKQWLEYEPELVELEGRLTVERKYGPPNYGEDPKTDEKARVPLLVLKRPVNVLGNPQDLMNAKPVAGIRRIQLSFYNLEGPHKQFIGRRVRVRGTLFQAHTGHHYTQVVMVVTSIKLPRVRRRHQELPTACGLCICPAWLCPPSPANRLRSA